MRYLIMETHVAHAVALDECGVFRKVVNRGYEVGQYVEQVIFFDEPICEPKKRESKVRAFPLRHFAAAAACICLVMVGFVQNSLVAYGAVHLRINPDVMVSLNRQQKVLAVEALNEDGEVLLQGYSGRRKTVEVVVDELTTKAEEMGYLAAEQEIRVELISDRSEWRQAAIERVTDTLHDKYEQTVTVTVEESEWPTEPEKTTGPVEQPAPEQKPVPQSPAEGDGKDRGPQHDGENSGGVQKQPQWPQQQKPQQQQSQQQQRPQQQQEDSSPELPAEEGGKPQQPQGGQHTNEDGRNEPDTKLPEQESSERWPQEPMSMDKERPAGHGTTEHSQDGENDVFVPAQQQPDAGFEEFSSDGSSGQKQKNK